MAEPDTKEIEALLAALNRSAERLQTLWFSFLALTIYFAVVALTVTHRMLLLEEPQSLPIINLKVPLLPFFVIAPVFYAVIHFYTLMMLVLLARSAGIFDKRLNAAIRFEPDRETFRARVENALFLQMLIGPKPEREGINGVLLAAIAMIALAVAPVLTLLLMQLMFLPYHSLAITWWHRALVLADFYLILTLWASYRYKRGATDFSPFAVWRVMAAQGAKWRSQKIGRNLPFAATVAGFLAILGISFLEGRWAGENWIGRADVTERANGVVFGLFPDRLMLADEIIVGSALLKEKQAEQGSRGEGSWVPTRSLGGRNYVGAVFIGADLRGVDLEGSETNLVDAQLSFALMQNARVSGAQMQRASLISAQLQDAGLGRADLQGADLSGAQLQGAHLVIARLQGANLSGAQLQQAVLLGAQWQGADLSGAQLQGADLSGAQLQGANLEFAELQGADLGSAHLQGAAMRGAQLQGADLSKAQMRGADLSQTYMFNVNTLGMNVTFARMRAIRTDKVKDYRNEISLIETGDVDRWIAEAKSVIPHLRFKWLQPGAATEGAESPWIANWSELQQHSERIDPDGKYYRIALANILGDIACAAVGAPYVARRFIGSDGLEASDFFARATALGSELDTFRNRLQDGRKNPLACPGVSTFTEADWQALKELKGRD